jgi:hypothetical protein
MSYLAVLYGRLPNFPFQQEVGLFAYYHMDDRLAKLEKVDIFC